MAKANETSQKKPNCKKGWACRYACLSREKKNCLNALEGQSKTYAEYLKNMQTTQAVKRVIGDSRFTQDKIDAALGALTTEGAKERVALLNRFIEKNQLQAAFTGKEGGEAPADTNFVNDPDVRKFLEEYTGRSDLTDQDLIDLCTKPINGAAGHTSELAKHVQVDVTNVRGEFEPDPNRLSACVSNAVKQANNRFTSTIDDMGYGVRGDNPFSATEHPSSEVLVTYLHEIGHQVYWKANSPALPTNRRSLSRYGRQDDDEWFAEHFTAWILDANAYNSYDSDGANFVDSVARSAINE